MPARLAMCMRRLANACAVGKCLVGRQCACAVGKVPGLVGKISGRLAKCLAGRQCACAVGKMSGRLAIQGFSAGKDLLGNFYRVHGIFSVEVGTNHVSIFLRKNGTSDNNLAPRRFFTQQLDCFFH